MFLFNLNKKRLKDLIPNGYIDIHSHLLFGIDDGAKTFDDTLRLTTTLISFGFESFIATPHTMAHVWENTTPIILDKNSETVALLLQNDIKVPFRSASEYLMDDAFVKRFQSEPLLVLKDKYVLVEMSYINAPMQLYSILFDLQVAGYKPILAHPERYIFYHHDFDEYKKLKRAGCLFQINLLSTVGYYGRPVFETAKKLLNEGMIDFVGSDVHHNNHLKAFEGKVLLKDLAPLKAAFENNSLFL